MLQTNRKQINQTILSVACIILLTIILLSVIKSDLENDYLSEVHVACRNSDIVIDWQLPLFNNADSFLITISGDDFTKIVRVPSYKRKYVYEYGIHGSRYTVSITELYKNGEKGKTTSRDILCFEENQLPNLPIVKVETENQNEPEYTVISAPEGYLRGTAQHCEAVPGVMSYKIDDNASVDSRAKILVRGNTSTIGDKHSYKLLLDNPINMYVDGQNCCGKEWLLLNSGDTLNNVVGEYLADICGMQWVIHMEPVNLVINGDWKGIYYLSESVNSCNYWNEFYNTGILIENDPYWWTPGSVYFDLDLQRDFLTKFTIKYPKISSSDDEQIRDLESYMQFIVARLMSLDEHSLDYIDVESFVSWIMVKDLMHIYDWAGSNMYYYLDTFDPDEYSDNVLHIGPLWDFDSGMLDSISVYSVHSDWSKPHLYDMFYRYLFQIPEFRLIYEVSWYSISSELSKDFNVFLELYYDEYGEAIEESRKLDAERWGREYLSLRNEIDYDELFVLARISVINNLVDNW